MSNYRIIASDLDGTLLASNGKISSENMDAIAKLAELGIEFVPASGRTLSEIPVELSNNPHIRYIIHSNGAVVYDKLTGEKLLNCIPFEVKNKLLDMMSQCDCHITVRFGGECYVHKDYQTEYWFDYYKINPEHKGVIVDYAHYADNFEALIREAKDVEVISVFFRNSANKAAFIEFAKNSPDIGIADLNEYNIEIFCKSAGKGNALVALAKMLDVPVERTISVGDSDNDSTIVLASGLGLATSNARDSLKKIADKVICSNDEHVVKYILKNYIIG